MIVARIGHYRAVALVNCVRRAIIRLVAVVAVLVNAHPAAALMVGTTPNAPPDTSNNPAATSGWTQGDPGWANAGQTGPFFYNGVYIGDGWMLTAVHTFATSVKFATDGPSYGVIPNQGYQVPNPAGLPGVTAANADLRLYRLNDDPGLPSLKIATQPLAVNDEAVFMAYGQARSTAEVHWSVDTSPGNLNPPQPHIWTQVASCTMSAPNCRHGYVPGPVGKRWGSNFVEDDQNVFGSSENDANLTVVVGINNNTIQTVSNVTLFNQNSSNPFESQVVSGDSGSPVFHKRNGLWELAGITLANYTFNGQNAINAVYGDASAFADLSTYAGQIDAIKAAHLDYSLVGDVNLDGAVDNSDISLFVANWGYNNGTGAGSITSWKHGDLTHDGKTDVNDFFKWRNGAGSASAAALGSLLGLSGASGSAVPEPAAALLVLGPAVLLAARFRRRRPALAV